MTAGPSVGQLLVAAFGLSRSQEPLLNKRWIAMSYKIGSQLPQSLLMLSFQQLGEVDLVCRVLEKELLSRPPGSGGLDLRENYLAVVSEWWIGTAYAICFTLKDRKILVDSDFLTLADDLRMVRVQTEKYQVPSDRDLAAPLQFISTLSPNDQSEMPVYAYDKNDRLKAHIPRRGPSARCSLMWEVIDVKANVTRWLERLELSDRMLDLLSPEKDSKSSEAK
jgi:hypothetical protein